MMNPLAGPAGPGKFSTRTDNLQMGSTGYGEGVETQAIQSGAPLAKTADVRGARGSDVRQAASQAAGTELFAPTERPDEPITSGMDFGPGPGSEALNLPRERSLSEVLASMIDVDPTGEVQDLYNFVASRGL